MTWHHMRASGSGLSVNKSDRGQIPDRAVVISKNSGHGCACRPAMKRRRQRKLCLFRILSEIWRPPQCSPSVWEHRRVPASIFASSIHFRNQFFHALKHTLLYSSAATFYCDFFFFLCVTLLCLQYLWRSIRSPRSTWYPVREFSTGARADPAVPFWNVHLNVHHVIDALRLFSGAGEIPQHPHEP